MNDFSLDDVQNDLCELYFRDDVPLSEGAANISEIERDMVWINKRERINIACRYFVHEGHFEQIQEKYDARCFLLIEERVAGYGDDTAEAEAMSLEHGIDPEDCLTLFARDELLFD